MIYLHLRGLNELWDMGNFDDFGMSAMHLLHYYAYIQDGYRFQLQIVQVALGSEWQRDAG